MADTADKDTVNQEAEIDRLVYGLTGGGNCGYRKPSVSRNPGEATVKDVRYTVLSRVRSLLNFI